MFILHYDSSIEELDAIKLGDVVGYGGGGKDKVVKISKELSHGGLYYEFTFANGHTRPIITFYHSSRNR